MEVALAEVAPVEEPRYSTLVEVPGGGDVPVAAEVGPETRGQSAQAKEAVDGLPAPTELMEVVDLEAEDEPSVPTEPAEVADLGAEGGHPAPLEPEAEAAALEAGDGEGPISDGEAEPMTPCSSPDWGLRKEP